MTGLVLLKTCLCYVIKTWKVDEYWLAICMRKKMYYKFDPCLQFEKLWHGIQGPQVLGSDKYGDEGFNSQVAEHISSTDYKLLSTTINYYIYVLAWLKSATKSQSMNISLTGTKSIGQWITSTIKIKEHRSKQLRETNQSRHAIRYPKKNLINPESQHPKSHMQNEFLDHHPKTNYDNHNDVWSKNIRIT